MFLEAKTWQKTPSELFNIDDRYVAYCLDEAVAMIGNWITHELESITGKNQRQTEARREQALKRLLGNHPRFKSPPTK